MNFTENKGRAGELLAMVDDAIDKGIDVTLDTYPYLPGCTTLAALLPSWASAGGPAETLKRLEDPETVEKIRVAVEETGCDGGHGIPTNWDEIQVGSASHPDLQAYSGRRVSEIAKDVGKTSADVFFDILRKDNLATSCLMHIGHEENVREIMQHRVHMSGSDAILHGKTLHPRAYGTFTRYIGELPLLSSCPVLCLFTLACIFYVTFCRLLLIYVGHYARDLGLFTIAGIISHLTSRPAKRLSVYPHRGKIAEGSAADLVLFDPETIKDMATFEEPKLTSKGIRYVVVNGQIAVDEGKMTGLRNGTVLRRKADGTVA